MSFMLGGHEVLVDGDPKTIAALQQLNNFQYISGAQNASWVIPPRKLQLYWEDCVDGLGLKTLERIEKDEIIIGYRGVEVSSEAFKTQPSDSAEKIYAVAGPDTLAIQALHHGNESRFVNHRCENYNSALKILPSESGMGDGRVVLYAKRTILPGVPIERNYGKEYGGVFECSCRSRRHTRPFKKRWPHSDRGGNGRFGYRKKLGDIVGRIPEGKPGAGRLCRKE